jgi:hypothetical protein
MANDDDAEEEEEVIHIGNENLEKKEKDDSAGQGWSFTL